MTKALWRAHVEVFVLAMPVLFRLAPLRLLLRLATPPRWFRPYRGIPVETLLAVVGRRLAQPRLMRRRACLRKGLTLYHFLALAGMPAEVHFGVYPPRPEAKCCRAHCWVSLDGRVLADPPEESCAEVLVYPRAGGIEQAGRRGVAEFLKAEP